jgi:hypothetical protein
VVLVCVAAAVEFLVMQVHMHVNVFAYKEDVVSQAVLDLPAETQMHYVSEDVQNLPQFVGSEMVVADVFVLKVDAVVPVIVQLEAVYTAVLSMADSAEH